MRQSYYRFMNEYIKEFRVKLGLALVLLILQNAMTIITPMIYMKIIDSALPQKDINRFFNLVILLVVVNIADYGFNFLRNYLSTLTAEGIAKNLRVRLNEKIPKLKSKFFIINSIGDIVSKYDKEINNVKNHVGYVLVNTVGQCVRLIFVLVTMGLINFKITLISLLSVIVYTLNYKYWGKRISATSKKNMELNSQAIEKITENYNNVLITKLYNAYNYTKSLFCGVYDRYYNNSVKLEVQYSFNIMVSAIILFISSGMLWVIGGINVIEGSMSIGLLTAMISYQAMLLAPIRQFSDFNNSYQATKISIDRLYSIYDYEEEKDSGIDISEDIYSIKFNKVSFSYDGVNKVLDEVSIEFVKGEITAIVGISGSGKSTIAKLITGLITSDIGNIIINNKDISELNLSSLRDNITLISQDSLFYKDTIRNNFMINKNFSENKSVELFKKLGLYEHINTLPLKLDEPLASGASNLSEGQKKRLDIIRGILRDSSVIIFDESTASIDSISRNSLFQIIKELKENKIIIIISHNLEELEIANRVLVFEQGNVVDIKNTKEKSKYISLVRKSLAI